MIRVIAISPGRKTYAKVFLKIRVCSFQIMICMADLTLHGEEGRGKILLFVGLLKYKTSIDYCDKETLAFPIGTKIGRVMEILISRLSEFALCYTFQFRLVYRQHWNIEVCTTLSFQNTLANRLI